MGSKLQYKYSDHPTVKRVAQAGLISKGLIYSLFGILILMATFGFSDQPVKLFGIIKYVMTFGWYGRLVVVLLAAGVLCYSAWKFLQMVFNTEDYPKNPRGYFIRLSWVGPFLFYLLLGGHAVLQLFNYYTGQFSYNNSSEGRFQDFLNDSTGKWVIVFLAITLAINGITLLFLAFKGKHTVMLTGRGYGKSPILARRIGFVGYFFYGLALLIIASLFATALFKNNEAYAEGAKSMFAYLIGHPLGKWLLVFIALGTVCYGVYFFLAARYRWSGSSFSGSSNSKKTGK